MPSLPKKHWVVYPKVSEAYFEKFPDIPRLVVQLLHNRQIRDEDAIHEFLGTVHTKFEPERPQVELKGISAAVKRVLQALEVAESIVVYGDYDADGVTSTTLMVQALQAFGAKVRPYIPNRFEEGYGLNKEALATLASEGASLVITVDCGVRSVDEVIYGHELGLSFIITDHHTVPKDERGQDILPPAVAVINPKRADCPYPFNDLAGVGVAFKLVQALQQVIGLNDETTRSRLIEEDLLDLVAIGTVADMVPLLSENRMLVKTGLTHVNESRRVGLTALIEQSRLSLGHITAGSVGFTIGPRLNAAGRLRHAQLAYRLLSTENPVEARQLAEKLSQINIDRQRMTQTFVDQAREHILADDELAPLYFIADPNFNQGVVGLVASRLADEFYRPILVAQQGETYTKGSARSIPDFDITQALDQCADLLVKHGGHKAAAGFTLENRNLAPLRTRLTAIAQQQQAEKAWQKALLVDAELNLRGVNYQLVQAIQDLQPFGYRNPTPRFVTRGLIVKHQTAVGRERNHLKLKLFDGKQIWDAIGFGMGQTWPPDTQLTTIDAVYTLEFNTWQGRTNLQLNLKDIQPRPA